MRFVSVRDLRGRSAKIWRDLPGEREMVITRNGRPVAILSAVSESNLEKSLAALRRVRAITAVASIQGQSASLGGDGLSNAESDSEIEAVRRERKR